MQIICCKIVYRFAEDDQVPRRKESGGGTPGEEEVPSTVYIACGGKIERE